MEEKVFPSPAVAGVLREHFVEARLHVLDGTKNIEESRALRERLAGVVTTPFYVALDPQGEASLGTFEGGGVPRAGEFLDFLQAAVAATGK